MKTCVSMNCPFLKHCKDYNFLVDREGGCKTQKAILDAAVKMLRVETPLGLIKATPCSDTANPGLWIELYRPSSDASMSLALIKYYSEDKELVTRVWGNAMSEYYTDEIEHRYVDEYFADGLVRQGNLMACSVSKLADHLSDNAYRDDSKWHFTDCDFTAIDEDSDLSDLSALKKDACGWYGIKAVEAGFDSDALVLMSDYYGGNCASIVQMFDEEDAKEKMQSIEKAILATLNINETVTPDTLLLADFDTGKSRRKSDKDVQLEEVWRKFGDIPMDPETENIEEDFLHFPAGTNRMEIWRWFDEQHSKGVAYLAGQDGRKDGE